ncbi:DUF4160 domain-containing protein [Bacteroidota bacterium]
MPKLYEYLGIIIFFWSDEHEPIHVHGRYQGAEMKAEFLVEDAIITEIIFKNVIGKKRFDSVKRNDFEKFVKKYSQEIVNKWIDYFVWKKDIKPEIITRRIR